MYIKKKITVTGDIADLISSQFLCHLLASTREYGFGAFGPSHLRCQDWEIEIVKVRGLKESEYFIVCILVSMIFSDMVMSSPIHSILFYVK